MVSIGSTFCNTSSVLQCCKLSNGVIDVVNDNRFLVIIPRKSKSSSSENSPTSSSSGAAAPPGSPTDGSKSISITVQTFKICETGIFAKDTPPKLIFSDFFWVCDQKFEWRARN